MKKWLVFLAPIFFSVSAVAQDFRHGFIIKQGQDTVQGWVAFLPQKKGAEKCLYRASENSQVEEFTANEIVGYGITQYKYFHAVSAPARSSSKRFFEVLSAGALNLFTFDNIIYLGTSDSTFALPPPLAGGTTREITQYLSLLGMAMSSCPQDMQHVLYDDATIARVVDSYNQCRNDFIPLPRGGIKKGLKLNFHFATGPDFGHLHLSGLSRFNSVTSISWPVGLGFRISKPSASDKFFLTLELFADKKVYQTYRVDTEGTTTNRADYLFRYNYLKIPMGVQVNLRPHNTFYFKGGFSILLLTSSKAAIVSETDRSGVVIGDHYFYDFARQDAWGVWFGVGYQYPISRSLALFVETRGEYTLGYAYTTTRKSSAQSLALYTGFTF